MFLKDLLKGFEYEIAAGSLEDKTEVSGFVWDNRKIVKDCLFVCIKGNNFDGHSVLPELEALGAAAVIVERDVELSPDSKLTVIKVKDSRYACAFVAANYYDNPANKLITIGITGTKGKTTTTYMCKSILENAGKKVGLIGTIETIIGDIHIPADNTTPEAYMIQEYMDRMVKAGIEIVVMEVSSQGLMLHRTQGFTFDYGIFTNIEPDHISPTEHRDFEHYKSCKARLFRQCRVGIVNKDDEHLPDIIKDHTCRILTYGIDPEKEYDFKAVDIRLTKTPGQLGVDFHLMGRMDMEVAVSTPGKFSVYNALCAIALCQQFGVSEENITLALKGISVKGRIEMVDVSKDFTLMIDHAHNAMALESLLSSLREYNPTRLVCVFGCGGNRSRDRRFEMGEVSGKLADFTIITSDNPRFEKPIDIINDIVTGIEKTSGIYVTIGDRKEAIRYAISHGRPGDIIVLAGKGHESYQEIEGKKYPMDERILIREIMEEMKQ